MSLNKNHNEDSVIQRLQIFFTHYNPDKLTSIPSLVEKYDGMVDDLFTALEEKYGQEEKAVAAAAIRHRLTVFFAHYNPEKLEDINQLLEKYVGIYDELFTALEHKYGPEATARLTLYFKHYNETKLDDVPALVTKYEGLYDDLFMALEKKYGAEKDVRVGTYMSSCHHKKKEEERGDDDGSDDEKEENEKVTLTTTDSAAASPVDPLPYHISSAPRPQQKVSRG